MFDSVQPHRWQPTRLPRPWDSPGKNTEVGCHFFLQCMKVKNESEVAQSCPTLSNPMECTLPASSIHGIFQARVLEWGAMIITMVNYIIFKCYESFACYFLCNFWLHYLYSSATDIWDQCFYSWSICHFNLFYLTLI